MNRGFFNSTLVTVAVVLTVSIVSVVIFAIAAAHTDAESTAAARLVQAHETTRSLLDARQSRLVLVAARVAADRRLAGLSRSFPVGATTSEVLFSHGLDGPLFVVSADGQTLAHNGHRGVPARFDTGAFFGAEQTPVRLVNGQAIQFGFVALNSGRDTPRLGVGEVLDQRFLERVAKLTGVDIALLDAQVEPLASTALSKPTESSTLAVPLSDRSSALTLRYDLSNRHGFRGFREFALKTAVLGLGVCALGIFLSWLLLGAIVTRTVAGPMRAVRNGMRRVQQGTCTEPVPEQGSGPVAALVRAFNQMQAELVERETRIVHHAEYDSLTGLTNRAVVADRLRVLCGRAQRNGTLAGAMVIDIERFGDINGSLGNDVGDAVLKEVARRLASNTRATDLLARVGGDEFLIVIEDMEDRLASHIANFLADTLERPVRVEGRAINLRVRVGAALFPVHCDTPEGLRRLANVAKTTAKETGCRVVMYEPGQDEKQLRELAVLADLPTAIAENHLHLLYQPKIDMKTRVVEEVEALVRWNHPQLGFIPPDEFIGLLEKHDKIRPLTDWVLKTAIKQVQNWHSRGFDMRVAVNISANDLMANNGLAKRIGALLHHYLVEPEMLSVEVTESAVVQDPDSACRVLNSLREVGIKVAVDDFGTGQTSLSLLKKLPLNELKIDQSFVRNLRADSGDGVIIKSTVDLGHNMGLVVVAEGVESTYAWNLLKSYGCDIVQGYLISKPLPSTDLEAWYLRLQARHESRLDLSVIDQNEQKTEAAGAPRTPPKPGNDLLAEILGDVSG